MKRQTGKRKLKVGKRPTLIKGRHETKKSGQLKVRGESTLKGNRFLE